MIDRPFCKYRSVAIWPEGTLCSGENRTEDDTINFSCARGAVKMLRQNGFGGNHQIYPVESYVEEVDLITKRVRKMSV